LPFIPPDQLLPWLLENSLLPINLAAIEEYWQYVSMKGVPGAHDKLGTGCVPLWIWGDDCVYNEQGSKLVVVAVGGVLDRRTSSKDTVFSLNAYQVDTWLLSSYNLINGQ